MKFKCTVSSLSFVFGILLFGSMFFLTGLLFFEYRYFKEQSLRMLELQQDYQSYIDTLKQNVRQKTTTPDIDDPEYYQGGEIALEDLNAQNLNVVNREVLYLRNAALGFGKAHNLEKVIKPLYDGGTWDANYTQAITQRPSSVQAKKKFPNKIIQKQNSNYFPVDFILSWPLNKAQFWISSKFGPRKKGFHYGLDMAALKGTPVYAAMAGVVIETSYTPNGYGKSIVIDHKKCKTRYAHLNDIYVKVGQTVDREKPIGCVGATGLVRGKNDASHLHFEVIDLFGKRINPLYILK